MEKTSQEIADAWFEYFNGEFYAFRGPTRKGVSDFANYLDFPQSQISQYLKRGGKVPKSIAVIDKLAKKLGPKVYVVLGHPVPDVPFDLLPEPLRSISREVRETLAKYTLSGDSPETGKIMDEIMKKYGYELISTEDRPSE